MDDFESVKTTPWEGVRNHQAKNFMKDMECGDRVRCHLELSSDIQGVPVGVILPLKLQNPRQAYAIFECKLILTHLFRHCSFCGGSLFH